MVGDQFFRFLQAFALHFVIKMIKNLHSATSIHQNI